MCVIWIKNRLYIVPAPCFITAVNAAGSRRNIRKIAENQCWKCQREQPDQPLTELHCCLPLERKSAAKCFPSQDTLQYLQWALIIHFIARLVSAGALSLGMSKP